MVQAAQEAPEDLVGQVVVPGVARTNPLPPGADSSTSHPGAVSQSSHPGARGSPISVCRGRHTSGDPSHHIASTTHREIFQEVRMRFAKLESDFSSACEQFVFSYKVFIYTSIQELFA